MKCREWINVVEPVSYLDGTYGGSRQLQLPATLPDPMYIVSCSMLCNNNPFPAGSAGVLSIILDKGGAFCAGCNPPYPQSQTGNFASLQRLAIMEVREGFHLTVLEHMPVPVRYSRSAGDIILVDIGGVGPAEPEHPLGHMAIQMCWGLGYLVDDGAP